MGLFGGLGSFIDTVGGGLLGGAGSLLGGAGDILFGGGSGTITGGGAPTNPGTDMGPWAEASKANMAMFVGGQIQQTMMQTNLMNLQGQRMQMMQQDKLDTNLKIAGLNQEAKMQEAQYRHDEKLLSLLNTHIEELVDDGMIDADSFA